ncbi:hypothetical protein OSTOST_08496 [Ostertagia ostertagi]
MHGDGGYQPPQPPAGGYQPPQPPAGGYQSPQPPSGGYQPPQPPSGSYSGGVAPPPISPPASGGYSQTSPYRKMQRKFVVSRRKVARHFRRA